MRVWREGVFSGQDSVPAACISTPAATKFPEIIEFRDTYARQIGANSSFTRIRQPSTRSQSFLAGNSEVLRLLKTKSLLDALKEGGLPTRRLEERAGTRRNPVPRKDLLVRIRWANGIRKIKRPELWNIFNSRIDKGESIRVFPFDWTELDIWLYIQAEHIPIVRLYFANEREVVAAKRIDCLDSQCKRILPGKDATAEVPNAFAWMRSMYGAIPFGSGLVAKIVEKWFRPAFDERTVRSITMKKIDGA